MIIYGFLKLNSTNEDISNSKLNSTQMPGCCYVLVKIKYVTLLNLESHKLVII